MDLRFFVSCWVFNPVCLTGASVSSAFLFLLAIANSVVLYRVVRRKRRINRRQKLREETKTRLKLERNVSLQQQAERQTAPASEGPEEIVEIPPSPVYTECATNVDTDVIDEGSDKAPSPTDGGRPSMLTTVTYSSSSKVKLNSGSNAASGFVPPLPRVPHDGDDLGEGQRRRDLGEDLENVEGDEDEPESKSPMLRILGRVTTFVDRPWKMYPVGVLFGLGTFASF